MCSGPRRRPPPRWRCSLSGGAAAAPVATQSPAEPVDPLEKAMNTLCPISKYKGRTLGQVLREDPRAILWVATKFTGDPEVSAAAKLICEQSVEQSA